MGHYIVLFLFWSLLAFVFSLVIRAFILKFTQPALPTLETITREHEPRPVKHEHEWRNVTEFVRQCRFRECGQVELIGSPPDGMSEYVSLMTSRQARISPIGEASLYANLDSRAWGQKCMFCTRVIPDPDNLPMSPFLPVREYRCPYCNNLLNVERTEKGLTYVKPPNH